MLLLTGIVGGGGILKMLNEVINKMNARYTLALSLALATLVAPRLAATPTCNGEVCAINPGSFNGSYLCLELAGDCDGWDWTEVNNCPDGCVLAKSNAGGWCLPYGSLEGDWCAYYEETQPWFYKIAEHCDNGQCDYRASKWREGIEPEVVETCYTSSCNSPVV